jgi:hypothetical protein
MTATKVTIEFPSSTLPGRVYAFALEGRAQCDELMPCLPRDNSGNALWGLPLFHPRLHLAADGPSLAVGAEHSFIATTGRENLYGLRSCREPELLLPKADRPTSRRATTGSQSSDLNRRGSVSKPDICG